MPPEQVNGIKLRLIRISGALPRARPLKNAPRTDERHLVANFTSNGHWHKNCAGNYKRQHHADKSKNNAVVVVLEIGFVFRAAGPMT